MSPTHYQKSEIVLQPLLPSTFPATQEFLFYVEVLEVNDCLFVVSELYALGCEFAAGWQELFPKYSEEQLPNFVAVCHVLLVIFVLLMFLFL